jgi:hypothetical protein
MLRRHFAVVGTLVLAATGCSGDDFAVDPDNPPIQHAEAEWASRDVVLIVDACVRDPEVIETRAEVRITAALNPAADLCMPTVALQLDEPLEGRPLIDGSTGEEIEIKFIRQVEITGAQVRRDGRTVTLDLATCGGDHPDSVDVVVDERPREVRVEVQVTNPNEHLCALAYDITLEQPLGARELIGNWGTPVDVAGR